MERTENAKSLFHKTEKILHSKKEELFRLGNTAKWDMSAEDSKAYDKNTLLADKELSFKLMCNKVRTFIKKDNISLHNYKQQYAYFATCLFSEFDRMRCLYSDRFNKQIINFSSRNVEILTNVSLCLI